MNTMNMMNVLTAKHAKCSLVVVKLNKLCNADFTST